MEDANVSPTLGFSKRIDEVAEAILLPEEWYDFVVIEDPKVAPNNAMREDPESEKAGMNWIVTMKSQCDEPEFSGRRFTLFFGVPKESDEENYTQDGQKISDAKMERIVEFVKNFGGDVGEDEVTLTAGARGQCYVQQKINKTSGNVENAIDIFNSGFKPPSGAAAPPDDVPF